MADRRTASVTRGISRKRRSKKKVSFMTPGEESPSEEEEDRVEPGDPESRVQEAEEPLRRRNSPIGINCYFLDQRTRISVMGMPLSDLVFSLLSTLLVTGSNLLLVVNFISLARAQDLWVLFTPAFILVDRLGTILYRWWSAPARRDRMQVLLDTVFISLFLDAITTGLSLLRSVDPNTMANVQLVEGPARSRKQWTAMPFLSAQGRLITRMKMMCLLSAASHTWQVLFLVATITHQHRYQDKQQMAASIACSTALVCWSVSISLPTVPVPRLFSSGYWIVSRTVLKLVWLLCVATSRLLACYFFSQTFGYQLLVAAAVRWLLSFAYGLLATHCYLSPPLRPSVPKRLLAASIHLLVFVHPQRGYLDNGYGVAHFLYLCEDIIMVYAARDVTEDDIMWIMGVFTVGVLFSLGLMVINMTVRHATVRVLTPTHDTPTDDYTDVDTDTCSR